MTARVKRRTTQIVSDSRLERGPGENTGLGPSSKRALERLVERVRLDRQTCLHGLRQTVYERGNSGFVTGAFWFGGVRLWFGRAGFGSANRPKRRPEAVRPRVGAFAGREKPVKLGLRALFLYLPGQLRRMISSYQWDPFVIAQRQQERHELRRVRDLAAA